MTSFLFFTVALGLLTGALANKMYDAKVDATDGFHSTRTHIQNRTVLIQKHLPKQEEEGVDVRTHMDDFMSSQEKLQQNSKLPTGRISKRYPKETMKNDISGAIKNEEMHSGSPGVQAALLAEEPAFQQDLQNLARVQFSSGIHEFDVAFKLAMSELSQNHVGGELIAGKAWTSLWTRDTSYTVSLAAGLLSPQASLQSLRRSTENTGSGTVWLQDKCGHFGGWPALTDSIVGAHGAWSLYLATGDKEFLSWAKNVTQNTLKRAEQEVYDTSSHLFQGCSSFMESNSAYPAQYSNNGRLVSQTKALSTNMLYYIGYKVAALMGRELKAKNNEIYGFERKAADLRDAIRSKLWLSDKGYYSYFQDENDQLRPEMEGLGESLALLAPEFESDVGRIDSIFAKTYRSNKGIPCLWPPFERSGGDFTEEYHNGRVWPFVQGYWAMAAARHGKADVFNEEMDKLVKLSQLKNTFAEYYNMDGSFAQDHTRQLWSDAGFLSMVYHGLFGIVLEPNLIRFSPIKPSSMVEKISLKNVKYRGMQLDLHISGSGSKIKSFMVDGKFKKEPVIESAPKTGSAYHPMTDSHIVEIVLDSNL